MIRPRYAQRLVSVLPERVEGQARQGDRAARAFGLRLRKCLRSGAVRQGQNLGTVPGDIDDGHDAVGCHPGDESTFCQIVEAGDDEPPLLVVGRTVDV